MEKVREAIANQFVSHTKRDFVDVAQGKQMALLSLGTRLGSGKRHGGRLSLTGTPKLVRDKKFYQQNQSSIERYTL